MSEHLPGARLAVTFRSRPGARWVPEPTDPPAYAAIYSRVEPTSELLPIGLNADGEGGGTAVDITAPATDVYDTFDEVLRPGLATVTAGTWQAAALEEAGYELTLLDPLGSDEHTEVWLT